MARLLMRSRLARQLRSYSDSSQMGDLGSGAGKGGGGGGSIREAGGAFGKRQAAQEEKYFREQEAKALEFLKRHHYDEINIQEKEIKRLQKEIDRRQNILKQLKNDD
uniref:ATPase inhibitor, mitochondrial n=1 Tax=Callorhinchus milii TaxID=7868 RepID=K4GJ46_CALMI|nr:ATPase inhibitor, mitochondrial precursor [Callorhinchus milii]